MNKLYEELDFRETPIGDLILQRRKYLQLDGQIVYEVKLGDAYLMSSMFYESKSPSPASDSLHLRAKAGMSSSAALASATPPSPPLNSPSSKPS